MPFSDADFINCDPFQVANPGALEPVAQIPLEDVFYGIPTDLQVLGHIQNGHVTAKLQNIAFKCPGVGAAYIGKAQLNLTYDSAAQTFDPLYGQFNEHGCGANWDRPESAQNGSSSLYVATVTLRAPEIVHVSSNPENNGAFLKKGANILVAVNTKSVIQQACGHPICLSNWCGAF